MDDKRFDTLAKRVGTSRRSVLKKMVGLGGAAAVARLGAGEAEAARRGYSGPSGPGQIESTRICTLSNPPCCMQCEFLPGADIPRIQQRLSDCVYDIPRHSCEECIFRALEPPYLGICWVA